MVGEVWLSLLRRGGKSEWVSEWKGRWTSGVAVAGRCVAVKESSLPPPTLSPFPHLTYSTRRLAMIRKLQSSTSSSLPLSPSLTTLLTFSLPSLHFACLRSFNYLPRTWLPVFVSPLPWFGGVLSVVLLPWIATGSNLGCELNLGLVGVPVRAQRVCVGDFSPLSVDFPCYSGVIRRDLSLSRWIWSWELDLEENPGIMAIGNLLWGVTVLVCMLSTAESSHVHLGRTEQKYSILHCWVTSWSFYFEF